MESNEMTNREKICRRLAQEYNDGELVNLGAGIPSETPKYLAPGKTVFFQNEGGVIGIGVPAQDQKTGRDFVDASGQVVSSLPGGMWFECSYSFALMRSGHLDKTILGGLEADQEGSLSNWIVPGRIVFGMGGAMDLIAGAKKVIVGMEHCTKNGDSRILKKCKLPLTGYRAIDKLVTEKAVFDVLPDGQGLVLLEVAPGLSVDDIRAVTEADFTVSDNLKEIEL